MEQASFSPCFPGARSPHSMNRELGALLTALLWPEQGKGPLKFNVSLQSLVSVTKPLNSAFNSLTSKAFPNRQEVACQRHAVQEHRTHGDVSVPKGKRQHHWGNAKVKKKIKMGFSFLFFHLLTKCYTINISIMLNS